MPDPTYKTFLSPGSCQLEITDLVAAANDDTGIDLYGVAWEIEQVLIAGEGFAASPTDVWVNERGILNIGQSLFDKINKTAEDNDNVPGQCTVVVKATSLVDSSKVARLKVLVGYPGEGGGGGGGGETPQIGDARVFLSQSDTDPIIGEEYLTNSLVSWSSDFGAVPYLGENIICTGNAVAIGVTLSGFEIETSIDDVKFYKVTIGTQSGLVENFDDLTDSIEYGEDNDGLWFIVPDILTGIYDELVIIGVVTPK